MVELVGTLRGGGLPCGGCLILGPDLPSVDELNDSN